jgi:hypothetical protein
VNAAREQRIVAEVDARHHVGSAEGDLLGLGKEPRACHDALGHALMVKVRVLLAKDEVFEQRRPAQPCLQRVLVVGNGHPLVVVKR